MREAVYQGKGERINTFVSHRSKIEAGLRKSRYLCRKYNYEADYKLGADPGPVTGNLATLTAKKTTSYCAQNCARQETTPANSSQLGRF